MRSVWPEQGCQSSPRSQLSGWFRLDSLLGCSCCGWFLLPRPGQDWGPLWDQILFVFRGTEHSYLSKETLNVGSLPCHVFRCYFGGRLVFELRASHLQSRHSTASVTPSVYFALVICFKQKCSLFVQSIKIFSAVFSYLSTNFSLYSLNKLTASSYIRPPVNPKCSGETRKCLEY
jgi:hypothetical protein